jgi:hypothetical protein
VTDIADRPEAPAWGGDPSIAWRIMLTAVPTAPLTSAGLVARLARLHRDQGWPGPTPAVVTGSLPHVRHRLAEMRDVPLVAGIADGQLVVSAFHAYVDGLGLLDALAHLTEAPVTTSARGVGERPHEDGGTLARLREVAFAPPAAVAPPPVVEPVDGDAFAVLPVEGRIRTAALVHAVVSAVVDHNTARGVGSRHVTVAVGAGRPAAPGEPLANRSELLRLRDLEVRSASEIEEALRRAPLSAAGGAGAAPGRLTTYALQRLGPRLGSTMLVSHLGEVETTAASVLAFYPVTAGGTGLSLGAVGHGGTTVLTLRGRGSTWSGAALERLLRGVVDRVQ